MINKRHKKIIIMFVSLVLLSMALYMRRPKSVWDLTWDKGFKAKSERIYYVNSIKRLISDWSLKGRSKMDNEGIYRNPNDRYLVIDMDQKAIWLELYGKIQVGDYIEFPPETDWILYHNFPGGRTELPGRTILKIRDRHPKAFHVFEQFYLRGAGPGGSVSFIISSYGGSAWENTSTDIKSGFNVIHKTDESFESMIVSEEEYQKYRNSLTDSISIQSEDMNIQPKVLSRLDENKNSWYGIRRNLYMEIEKQFKNYDCPIRNIHEEPGPDFSAARFRIQAENNPNITHLPENNTVFDTYFNIDHLEKGVWYAKNIPEPHNFLDSTERDNYLPNTEFFVSSESELLKAGRELQNSNPIPESKWEATLSNGTTYQFIGICNHPSVGKQWWAPDGSPLDFVPCINERFIEKPSEEMNIYEFAWVTKELPRNSSNIKRTFVGSYEKTLSYIPIDRYGDAAWDFLNAKAYAFDKSQKVTDCKMDITYGYKTAITIKDKAEEIKFLDKYRVILNPPEIENGKIVIRCYEEGKSGIKGYDTFFRLEGHSLRYSTSFTYDDKTGLKEHKHIFYDTDPNQIDQIEGVSYKYQKHSVITFKNISLVPGEDFGVEIEVLEAEEK